MTDDKRIKELQEENLALNKYVDELLEKNKQLNRERDMSVKRVLSLEVAYRHTIAVMQDVLANKV